MSGFNAEWPRVGKVTSLKISGHEVVTQSEHAEV